MVPKRPFFGILGYPLLPNISVVSPDRELLNVVTLKTAKVSYLGTTSKKKTVKRMTSCKRGGGGQIHYF